MATQQFIIEAEKRIIDANTDIEETRKAMLGEYRREGVKHPHLYPENRDCWGTLRLNALTLRNTLNRLITDIDIAMGQR